MATTAKKDYKVLPPDDGLAIICLHCDREQVVSRRALSVTCKYCSKSLKLEPVTIKQYEARRAIETCGMVTIEKKGNVVADRINCGTLIVKGKIKGDVKSRGQVFLDENAEIKGDIVASTISIGPGASIEGKLTIGPRPAKADPKADPPENGKHPG